MFHVSISSLLDFSYFDFIFQTIFKTSGKILQLQFCSHSQEKVREKKYVYQFLLTFSEKWKWYWWTTNFDIFCGEWSLVMSRKYLSELNILEISHNKEILKMDLRGCETTVSLMNISYASWRLRTNWTDWQV